MTAEVRRDDAVQILDKLADLLADSLDLRVKETPAITTINEVLELLGGKDELLAENAKLKARLEAAERLAEMAKPVVKNVEAWGGQGFGDVIHERIQMVNEVEKAAVLKVSHLRKLHAALADYKAKGTP